MTEHRPQPSLPAAEVSRTVRVGPRTFVLNLSKVEFRENGGESVVHVWVTFEGSLLTLRRLGRELSWDRCSQIMRLIHQAMETASSGFYPPVAPDYGDPTPKIEYRAPEGAPRIVDGVHNYWDRPFFFTISVWLGGVTAQGDDAEYLRRLERGLTAALRQMDSAIDLPLI